MFSECDFDTAVKFHTVIFLLHGVFLGTLIVAQGLVEEIVAVGEHGEFCFMAECVAYIEIHVFHGIVVTVVECACSHFVDECGRIVE